MTLFAYYGKFDSDCRAYLERSPTHAMSLMLAQLFQCIKRVCASHKQGTLFHKYKMTFENVMWPKHTIKRQLLYHESWSKGYVPASAIPRNHLAAYSPCLLTINPIKVITVPR